MNVFTVVFLLNMAKNLIVVLAFLLAFFVDSGRGYFIIAAVLIFLLGGMGAKQMPDICPECGTVIPAESTRVGGV